MHQPTTRTRYDFVARSLHWLSALLIAIVFAIGLTVDVPPKAWYPVYINTHALLGIAILALALIRVGWRLGHAAPAAPAGTGPLWTLAIKIGHGALYLMMIVTPIIGFGALFARGLGIHFGLFTIASPIARDKALTHRITEVHQYAAYALIALAVGHMLAALYHQYVMKDGVLLRMMPERRG